MNTSFYSFPQFLAMTTVFLPLIFFCCLPVKKWLRIPGWQFAGKTAVFVASYLLTGTLLIRINAFFMNKYLSLFPVLFFVLHLKSLNINIWKALFLHLTSLDILCYSYMLTIPVDYLFNGQGRGTWFSTAGILMFVVITWILFPILYYFFFRRMDWLIDYLDNLRIWRIMCLIPAIFSVTYIFMLPLDYNTLKTGRLFTIYVALFVILFLINLFCFLLLFQITQTIYDNEKLQKTNQMLALQASQYAGLKSRIEESRQLRHDFHHQIMAISGMADAGNFEELKDYLKAYLNALPDDDLNLCPNPAVDALARHYNEYARRVCVTISWQLDLPPTLPVPEPDFILMLGNLLENSIDGACTMPEGNRTVTVSAAMPSECSLILLVKNNYTGSIRKKGEHYYSTKHLGFGIGLASVKSTVLEHNGSMYIDHRDGEFTVRIRLNRLNEHVKTG